MPRLQLESSTDTLDLDYFLNNGRGIQVTSGVTGLGLPPKQLQWLEGAGDGATPRGRRTLARDLDLPLMVSGRDRADLKDLLDRLSSICSGPMTLRLVEDDGSDWSTGVEHVGGGQYAYGVDTDGETDFYTVLTVRAGDPYFTYSIPNRKVIGDDANVVPFLDSGLVGMNVASSQALGDVQMENTGTAKAYPIWTVVGPGRNFKAIAPNGDTLYWVGILAAGEELTFDTKAGTVVDKTGANRYSNLAPAPRFWAIPHGLTTAHVELLDTTPGVSKVIAQWNPRKWMVI